MSILALLAMVVGLVTASAYLPQAYRIFKRKSSGDISIFTFVIFCLSMLIWMLYGIELRNLPIIIPNAFALCGGILVIGLSIYYRKNK